MSKKETELNPTTIADEVLVSRIYLFRDQKVMLDSDLAKLYGVETKRINEQVRRNSTRFPKEFIFNSLFLKGKMDSYGIYVYAQ